MDEEKIPQKLRPDLKPVVNNEEGILNRSGFGSGHYLTCILQCKLLYFAANQLLENTCKSSFQIYFLLNNEANRICRVTVCADLGIYMDFHCF